MQFEPSTNLEWALERISFRIAHLPLYLTEKDTSDFRKNKLSVLTTVILLGFCCYVKQIHVNTHKNVTALLFPTFHVK